VNEAQADAHGAGAAALAALRNGTRGTEYEGRLFLVGGYVRDRLLGRPDASDDLDLVLEGDALAVAQMLWRQRIADYRPVEYGQFGTTQVQVKGHKVEIVTARAETYRQGSRKPIVTPGTLQTDAERRDFTVNTFLENLHSGEILDPTKRGFGDLERRVLRTPLDPGVTFSDDPLRMLRACRFAAKLGFEVAPEAYAGIVANAGRCNAEHGISFERIREELNKTLLAPGAARGLAMMRETALLDQFAPELALMHGVTQNRYHRWDVWEHTLHVLSNLPDDAPLELRLAALLHDVGKPRTRTVDAAAGDVHFYGHEDVGARMAAAIMERLRYSVAEIRRVTGLVASHMRFGAYTDAWTDAAVRRLIRTVGDLRGDLFHLADADIRACNTEDFPFADLGGLAARMTVLDTDAQVTRAVSPLSGQEIMALLHLPAGPAIGRIKDALTDAVVAGELAPDDRAGAERIARGLLSPAAG
jgi:poly(A) polymerase